MIASANKYDFKCTGLKMNKITVESFSSFCERMLIEDSNEIKQRLKSAYKISAKIFKEIKPNESGEDLDAIENAIDLIKQGDVASLKIAIKAIDTYQRELVLSMINPELWASLGVKPLNIDRALVKYKKYEH
jgi:hypothetical protein